MGTYGRRIASDFSSCEFSDMVCPSRCNVTLVTKWQGFATWCVMKVRKLLELRISDSHVIQFICILKWIILLQYEEVIVWLHAIEILHTHMCWLVKFSWWQILKCKISTQLIWSISFCELLVRRAKNGWQLKRTTWVTALGQVCLGKGPHHQVQLAKIWRPEKKLCFVRRHRPRCSSNYSFVRYVLQQNWLKFSGVWILWFFWPCIWHPDLETDVPIWVPPIRGE